MAGSPRCRAPSYPAPRCEALFRPQEPRALVRLRSPSTDHKELAHAVKKVSSMRPDNPLRNNSSAIRKTAEYSSSSSASLGINFVEKFSTRPATTIMAGLARTILEQMSARTIFFELLGFARDKLCREVLDSARHHNNGGPRSNDIGVDVRSNSISAGLRGLFILKIFERNQP